MTKDKTSTDKRFRVSSKGVILDTQTSLEWLVGPDKNTDHCEAEKWIKGLGGKWRMPTTKELKEIYDKGKGSRNMDPVFKTTAWWIWAERCGPSHAFTFGFYGGYEHSYYRDNANNSQAFAVRSGK